MRKRLVTVATLLAVALLASSVPAGASPATRQHTDVLAFDGFDDVGEAILVRNDNSLFTRVRLSGLEPGVYTLWWVVWNAPEHCDTPYRCVAADLFNDEVQVAIGGGGGGVVGSEGGLNLAASLREGDELEGFPTEFGIPLADGLREARHAEVHLVLRSHGEKIPGMTDQMLRTFNGGCVYEGVLEDAEPAYGPAGPNRCEDSYFAVLPSEDAAS